MEEKVKSSLVFVNKCIGCPYYDPDFGCLDTFPCDVEEVAE